MTRIPTDQWTSCVDPVRPDTLNDNGQWVTAGELWQAGESGLGWMHRRHGLTKAQGFALEKAVDGEIHSYPVDGDTMRTGFRPEPALPGAPMVLVNRMHWTNHPDYDIARQTSIGTNLSVPWPAGGDRLAWDATRHGKSAIADDPADDLAIAESTDGTFDRVLLCHVLRIEPWMLGNNLAAGAGSIHAHWSPRSPFTVMWGRGEMQVVGRTTTEPIAGHQQPPAAPVGSMDITELDVGTYWGVVHDVGIDPFHGHLRTWVRRSDAKGWQQVVSQENGLGYTYQPGDSRAGLFYLRLASMTGWHNDNKFAPQNWDQTYGPLRETRYAWSGGIINPTVTLADVMGHAEVILLGTDPTPPPPDPPDPGEVAELRLRVEALEGAVARQEARWEGLRRLIGDS